MPLLAPGGETLKQGLRSGPFPRTSSLTASPDEPVLTEEHEDAFAGSTDTFFQSYTGGSDSQNSTGTRRPPLDCHRPLVPYLPVGRPVRPHTQVHPHIRQGGTQLQDTTALWQSFGMLLFCFVGFFLCLHSIDVIVCATDVKSGARHSSLPPWGRTRRESITIGRAGGRGGLV